MRSVNKVILIGNLTRDPEVRQTPNGQSVTTFGIATNREWATRDGQRHTSSEFHEVVAWSRLAEISGQFLKKGKLVYIEGYLKTRSWDTPEGIKKFKTEIVIQDMIMLEKRQQDGNTDQGADQPDYIPEEGGMHTDADTNAAPQHDARPAQKTYSKPAPAAPAPKEVKEPVAVSASASAPVAVKQGPVNIDDDLGL